MAALNREAADTTDAELARFNALMDEREALKQANQGLSDQINALYDQRDNKSSPPAGPFVGKTEAWVALALKRMVTYAADNGFDRVAFINGEQSAQRYDLSQQVQTIEWAGNTADGVKIVTIGLREGNDIEFRVKPDGTTASMSGGLSGNEFTGKNLDDVVGKEIAEKIMAERDGQLSGNGLKVGGSGMRSFYDQIVPNIARDVLKKLGGGPLAEGAASASALSVERDRGGYVVSRGDDVLHGPYDTRGEALSVRRALEGQGGMMPDGQLGFDITPALRQKVAAGLPLFRLGQTGAGAASPQSRQAVQTVRQQVEAMTANWENAPEVVVAFDMNDAAIPLRVREHNARQKKKGARGEPDGFVFGGKVYLLAKNLTTPQLVTETLFHEALGHLGLRGLYGKGMQQVLNQVILARRAEVLNKVLEYGLDPTKPKDMREAAEEVLANLAQTRPELGLVKRAVAAVRAWLRANVPGFAKMAVSDADLIAKYILPARRFVEDGSGGPGPRGGQPVYLRGKADQTATPAFKKWFGDSKVAKAGEPLVVYHGTNQDFSVFKNEYAGKTWEMFSTEPAYANGFAGNRGGRLMPVYLSLQNPLDLSSIPALRGDARVKLVRILQRAGVQFDVGQLTHDRDLYQMVNMAGHKTDLVEALQKAGFDGIIMPDALEGMGRPGDRTEDLHATTYVVFDPTRIKSATGNNGDFDGTNPDIRYSRSAVSGYTQAATAKLNEYLSHPGNMSLWDRTVGSQYHLAERFPTFKRVFTAAQNFINDVSYYANEAANQAPSILPRLDTWRDLGKSAVSAADNQAIGAPILEGTLNWARDVKGKPVLVSELKIRYDPLSVQQKAKMLLDNRQVSAVQLKRWKASALPIYDGAVGNRFDAAFLTPGVVWTDAELKAQFKLTGEKQADGRMNGQIGLYREFRAATDKSLDNLAKADLLRFGGKDVEALRDMVMEALDADEAAMLLRDYLISLAGADPTRAKGLLASADGMVERGDKVLKLKKRGYAPLSRFGRYAVDVVVDGERQYFSLFETMAESNQMAAQLREEFGAANVQQSKMSQKEFEQYQGISPESLELFGNMLGLDSTGSEAKDQVFQAYLKLTKTNRSAMRRMIHRKGTDGFSQEIGRVLASFVYSNARQTSAGLHMGELGEAVNQVDRNPDGTRNGQGELKDHAIELANYIKKPREEAQAMRAILFAQYLGGSVASAMVNFTQPFTVSLPYLGQYGGAAKAGKALLKAMQDQKEGKVLEPGLNEALVHAQEAGVVSPQAVHELQAQAQGRAALRSGDGTPAGNARATARNAWAKLAIGWGQLFGLAEQVNRRSTFIAAYRMALAHRPVLQARLASASAAQQADIRRQLAEVRDPQAFALKAVNETQFINNKANKAKFARGPIGAVLMTFKSYSTNWLELLHRLSTQGGPEGKQAALLMLAALLLMAGASGLPGADDLDDIIDFFAQRLGYNFATKKAKQQFLEDNFGKALGGFLENGLTGIPGAPLDISSRMSMGNLFPGTGLLLKKQDHTGDLKELLGPVGDLAQRVFTAGDLVLSGNAAQAGLAIAPKAVSNWAKSADMGATGSYNDAKGNKVLDTTPAEAVMKAVGFQPASVARVQEANYLNQRAKDFYNQRVQDINARWAKGIYEKDPGQVDKARRMLASWNEQNPEQRIHANMPAIVKRVKEMRKTKDERIADTAPKSMKARMKREVAEMRASML
ncbi:conserved phage mega protein [Polaromonas sp. CG9_12]|nr:conserved phage mega protein [Polaromonas sp. CG9_12]